ncbi:hypothetical protein ACFSM7_08160 [Clavibacter michiganensis subsp. tessellarius]|uniref:hypothetical protein n=1 Tax=Clavibacter tessellarius TaxID=31965 RepID=UPI003637544D
MPMIRFPSVTGPPLDGHLLHRTGRDGERQGRGTGLPGSVEVLPAKPPAPAGWASAARRHTARSPA